ncbi:hypothetical protein QYE76_030384 [Lolium multiflorum]|uniref:NB-ARC domain-containing protein n=1 Tax=Lolium multiflorum TaxID=4521 RepID=A0AAD8VIR3_LOLMU|nr:hypothetical protein QYE76_030384 [Lolium multiflorum]
MYLLVCVDDIILVSSSSKAAAALITALGVDFAIKDLGPLHFFLGIEVAHQYTGLALTEKKYSLDLLRHAGMLKCKMSPTPMSSTDKFLATDGVPLSSEDATEYRSIVGGLEYLTITCPDLSFAVNKVCQYLHAPTDVHWRSTGSYDVFIGPHMIVWSARGNYSMALIENMGISLGKSVLSRAVRYAESAVAKEVALQLGIQRDQAFITDELEMMQGFLMIAHDDHDNHNRVVKIWVKQVRDVAYDVEDCLQDFAVCVTVRRSWWRIPRKLLHRRRVAKRMKELRAKVEDVSQRNLRYCLIKGSGSKPISTEEQSVAIATATMSSVDEVRRQNDKAKLALLRLISKKDDDLKVIAVSGTNSVGLVETSVVKRAYEDPRIHKKFECCAWIRLLRPLNLIKFLQSIVRQFYVNYLQQAKQREKNPTDAQVLRRMGMMNEEDLANEFKRYINEKSFLIVLDDLHTVEEWGHIKTCFPQSKKGSRIIVLTELVEVASLCVGTENVAPEHKQLFADLHAFYEKVTLKS